MSLIGIGFGNPRSRASWQFGLCRVWGVLGDEMIGALDLGGPVGFRLCCYVDGCLLPVLFSRFKV